MRVRYTPIGPFNTIGRFHIISVVFPTTSAGPAAGCPGIKYSRPGVHCLCITGCTWPAFNQTHNIIFYNLRWFFPLPLPLPLPLLLLLLLLLFIFLTRAPVKPIVVNDKYDNVNTILIFFMIICVPPRLVKRTNRGRRRRRNIGNRTRTRPPPRTPAKIAARRRRPRRPGDPATSRLYRIRNDDIDDFYYYFLIFYYREFLSGQNRCADAQNIIHRPYPKIYTGRFDCSRINGYTRGSDGLI